MRAILTKDAQIKKLKNQSVPIVRGHMLHHIKGVQSTKSRHSDSTGQQQKIICHSSRPKLSPAAQNNTDIFFYSRTANETCSKCGHPKCPTTGILHQPKTGLAISPPNKTTKVAPKQPITSK